MDRDATDPEVGDLGHAPDAIAAELDKVRRDSAAYNRQLLQRNRELAAIAAVAQAISTEQLDLAGTLERTLQVFLEVTGLRAGWVMLLPEGGGEPILASSAGLSPEVAEKQAVFRSPECECGKVLDSRRPLVVHPVHTACLIRGLDLGDGQAPTCHAAVPLSTRSKVLGVLNLAGHDPAALDAELLNQEKRVDTERPTFRDPSQIEMRSLEEPRVRRNGQTLLEPDGALQLRSLVKCLGPDLKERVLRAFRQWNLTVRDHMRNEMGLRLTVGDERQGAPCGNPVSNAGRPSTGDVRDGPKPALWVRHGGSHLAAGEHA